MITASVQKSQKPLSPARTAVYNDQSLAGHDITPVQLDLYMYTYYLPNFAL